MAQPTVANVASTFNTEFANKLKNDHLEELLISHMARLAPSALKTFSGFIPAHQNSVIRELALEFAVEIARNFPSRFQDKLK
jgi:hypothetical protein